MTVVVTVDSGDRGVDSGDRGGNSGDSGDSGQW